MDALYLSSLNSMVNKALGGRKRFIYASLDLRARLIARMAMAFGADGPNRDAMASMLFEWWSKKDANAIADKLTEIALDIDSPHMAAKRRKAAESKRQSIAAGEQAILDWSPDIRPSRGPASPQ